MLLVVVFLFASLLGCVEVIDLLAWLSAIDDSAQFLSVEFVHKVSCSSGWLAGVAVLLILEVCSDCGLTESTFYLS